MGFAVARYLWILGLLLGHPTGSFAQLPLQPLSFELAPHGEAMRLRNEFAAAIEKGTYNKILDLFASGNFTECLPEETTEAPPTDSNGHFSDPRKAHLNWKLHDIFSEFLLRLQQLSPEKKEAYREKASPLAKQLLQLALQTDSIEKLEEVALRYPLSNEAAEALGRLMFISLDHSDVLGAGIYAAHLVRYYDSKQLTSTEQIREVARLGSGQPAFPDKPQSAWSKILEKHLQRQLREPNYPSGKAPPIRFANRRLAPYDLAFSPDERERARFLRLNRLGLLAHPEQTGCSAVNPFAWIADGSFPPDSWLAQFISRSPRQMGEILGYLAKHATKNEVAIHLLKREPETAPFLFAQLIAKMKEAPPKSRVLIDYVARNIPTRQILEEEDFFLDLLKKQTTFIPGVVDLLGRLRAHSYRTDELLKVYLSKEDPTELEQRLRDLHTYSFWSAKLEEQVKALFAHGTMDVQKEALEYFGKAKTKITDEDFEMFSQLFASEQPFQLTVGEVFNHWCHRDKYLVPPSAVRDLLTANGDVRDQGRLLLSCLLMTPSSRSLEYERLLLELLNSPFEEDRRIGLTVVSSLFRPLSPEAEQARGILLLDPRLGRTALESLTRTTTLFPKQDYTQFAKNLRYGLETVPLPVATRRLELLGRMKRLEWEDVRGVYHRYVPLFEEEPTDRQKDFVATIARFFPNEPLVRKLVLRQIQTTTDIRSFLVWFHGLKDWTPYVQAMTARLSALKGEWIDVAISEVDKQLLTLAFPDLTDHFIQTINASSGKTDPLVHVRDLELTNIPEGSLPRYREMTAKWMDAFLQSQTPQVQSLLARGVHISELLDSPTAQKIEKHLLSQPIDHLNSKLRGETLPFLQMLLRSGFIEDTVGLFNVLKSISNENTMDSSFMELRALCHLFAKTLKAKIGQEQSEQFFSSVNGAENAHEATLRLFALEGLAPLSPVGLAFQKRCKKRSLRYEAFLLAERITTTPTERLMEEIPGLLGEIQLLRSKEKFNPDDLDNFRSALRIAITRNPRIAYVLVKALPHAGNIESELAVTLSFAQVKVGDSWVHALKLLPDGEKQDAYRILQSVNLSTYDVVTNQYIDSTLEQLDPDLPVLGADKEKDASSLSDALHALFPKIFHSQKQ